MATNNNPQQVVTGKVRLSYAQLFNPTAKKPGDDPKYSTTILLPKSDYATKQKIDAAVNAAIQAGVTSLWNGVKPPQVPIPIHDGDGVRPSDGMPFSEECKGHWVFTASSKQQPQIVDLGINPILSQSEVYSGMYARVSVRFYPYFNSGKRGIGCGLGNVQKLEDGEPLGGRTNAADDFGGGYAPAPAYPQQPAYQPPVQPGYQQPSYPQQQPVQPAYPQQPVQIDPITGRPVNGGIMGL